MTNQGSGDTTTRGAPRRALGSLCLLLGAFALMGPSCEPMMRTRLVASGVPEPIYVASPPGDSRLFIVGRAGTVRILESGSVLPTPFLDIGSRVGTAGEGGLLSIAFSPSYASDGHFYVFYSNPSNTSVLSRFRRSASNPNLADASSEHVLLTVQPAQTNHKGGTIAFSPIDGYLYVGLGDGGTRTTARDPSSLLGKFLRLDVSGGPTSAYAIPADNPFVGPADGVRDEIWSFGFRNPFRWSFDRETGDLWIGDVGQGAFEEIDFEPANQGGGDYGWPTHEGDACLAPTTAAPCEDPLAPDRYTFPVYTYGHDEGCSITGGSVSRGNAAFLYGSYLFADFCSGHIWALVEGQRVEIGGMLGLGLQAGISALAEDAAGAIHLVQLTTGRIYRIE
jgi:hypothetical protein